MVSIGAAGNSIGSIGATIVGGVLAAVTILGLISSQVNQSGNEQGNVSNPTSQIDYGR